MYSITVTGALGLPRTLPFCGYAGEELLDVRGVRELGRRRARARVGAAGQHDAEHDSRRRSGAAITPAAISTRGDARRCRRARTGGGAVRAA